jgi:aspartokinase/homoserine dehydrogenase 1
LNSLLVMKFGGTSVGSADRMKGVAAIAAAARKTRPVAIVVSAMSKITDLLLDAMRRAESGDRVALDESLATLRTRHEEAVRGMFSGSRIADVQSCVNALIAQFERITGGMLLLGDRPPRSVDEAVAIGERLSAYIVASYLTDQGVPSEPVNGADVIVTDAIHGNASPVMDRTREKARTVLQPLLDAGILPVMTGFNGATIDGKPTTLGRGGSDFSASILAAALDAGELWIWTDVDGIMTADPRLVPDAAVLDEVTYNEAAELAYNGAKVLHPRTLAPLIERGIPVWSKNSFDPSKPGTKITTSLSAPDTRGARAVTSMSKVALISMEPASASLIGAQVVGRALEAMARANVEVLALTSSSYRQTFCFLVRGEELKAAIDALDADLSIELTHGYVKPIEVDENVGLLAIVGEDMRGHPGLAGRIFTAISREDVNIIAIAQGSSELTISVVVRRDGLEKAVRAVHAECRLGVAAPATA